MKKNIFISAALAMVAFTACQQEKLGGDDTTVDGFRVYAEDTKATLNGCKVVFEEGDAIDIYADDADVPAIYSYTASDDMFVPTGTEADGAKYSVIYPSQENKDRTIINIPYRQKATNNGVRQTCLYMAGTSTSKEISLKHLVGLWQIDLLPAYDGQKITMASLTFIDKKHRVNGNFEINWNDYSIKCTDEDNNNGYRILAADINYEMRAGTPLKIYFALPEGKYDGGFQFVASMADGTKMTIKSSSTINIVRGQITKVKNDVNYTLFASGSGTASDPYILKTADHWNNMVTIVNKGEETYQKAYYQLDANIDFNGNSVTPIKNFKGVLDGNGCTIMNAYIGDGTKSDQAFFYLLNGTVKNLNFDKINVNAKSSGAVISAGDSDVEFAIENCHVANSAVTTADDGGNAAGIVARCNNSGVIISGCSVSNSTITAGNENVGGIVGYLGKGTVDCVESSANTIAGGSRVGGVVGTHSSASLFNAISTDNTVSVLTASCGGVIGICNSDAAIIINIFSDGNSVECKTQTNAAYLGLIMGGINTKKNYYIANTLTLKGTVKYVFYSEKSDKPYAGGIGIVIGYAPGSNTITSSYYFDAYKSLYDAKFYSERDTATSTTDGLRFAVGVIDGKSAGSDKTLSAKSETELTDGTVLTALNTWVKDNKETYPTLKSWAAGEDDFPILILSETSAPGANSLNVVESNY